MSLHDARTNTLRAHLFIISITESYGNNWAHLAHVEMVKTW